MNSSEKQSAKVARIKGVDLRTALERYGVKFNRQGFALCPFHDEKTASFFVKNSAYHCFGCNMHGDLLDFAMRRFNLDFNRAMELIAHDFGIDTSSPPSIRERLAVQRIQREKSQRKKLREEAERAYLGTLSRWLDAWNELSCAASKEPMCPRTADAYWNELKARNALNEAERRRLEVIRC